MSRCTRHRHSDGAGRDAASREFGARGEDYGHAWADDDTGGIGANTRIAWRACCRLWGRAEATGEMMPFCRTAPERSRALGRPDARRIGRAYEGAMHHLIWVSGTPRRMSNQNRPFRGFVWSGRMLTGGQSAEALRKGGGLPHQQPCIGYPQRETVLATNSAPSSLGQLRARLRVHQKDGNVVGG